MNDERQIKYCAYCAAPVEKPATWSMAVWLKKTIHCCRDHVDLARRVDCTSYLGRFLLANEVKLSVFHEKLGDYVENPAMQFVIRIANNGLNHKHYAFNIKDMAQKMAFAVHDLVPDMTWGENMPFDYRMIINENESLFWEDIYGGSGALQAIKHAGLSKAGFVDFCSDSDSHHVTNMKLKLCSLFDDVSSLGHVNLLYGEYKWKKMLQVMLSKNQLNDVPTSICIQKILSEHFDTNIDFRRILDPLYPRDYWRSIKTRATKC